jgi:hypothetical protein
VILTETWSGSALLHTRGRLADGHATTVHAARAELAATSVRLVHLDPPRPLPEWCAEQGIARAITGGCFRKPECVPLGEHCVAGRGIPCSAFERPWDGRRPALEIGDARPPRIARRERLAVPPAGDLLQAGPLLVEDGARAFGPGDDPDGFSADAELFDEDITEGRQPRAAVALSERHIVLVTADGRSEADAGLSLLELADVLVALGAHVAVNLDGGASAALVWDGDRQNTPRADDGSDLPEGQPTPTALVLENRHPAGA